MANDMWRSKKSGVGLRPSMAKLVEKLDPEGESFARTAAILMEMASAGVEIDESVIDIAIRLAAQKQSCDTEARVASRRLPEPARLWSEQDGRESIVYYIRRGNLIKIGTTTDPVRRFQSLMPDEILAWEPGGSLEEAHRHRQFRRLRQGLGEYFRMEPDLLRHCKRLCSYHGQPDERWATTTTVGLRLHRRAPVPSEMPLPDSVDLVTAAEAAERTGVNSRTVRAWIARKRLRVVTYDEAGRMLFYLDHVKFLKSHSRAYRDTA